MTTVSFLPVHKNLQTPPLSLYIHLPWCKMKCPYCDFNSHRSPKKRNEKEYIEALIEDIELSLPSVWGRPLNSIFIGGGTPSLFSPILIDHLLSKVRSLFNFPPHIEITLEANPDSSDSEKFKEFFDAGINRLSLGVQSFDNELLSYLGRVHDGQQAYKAAVAAVEIFPRVNLDLMYAVPKQTRQKAKEDLQKALEIQSQHLSLYQLTLEPNTPFFHTPPQFLPTADDAAEMGEFLNKQVLAAGYEHYEVSAYAKSGYRSQHNLNYWQYGDYFGVGAGAHSKITTEGKVIRETRISHPTHYMTSKNKINTHFEVKPQEIGFEFMLNALRLMEGFSLQLLQERIGLPTRPFQNTLAQAEKEGFLIFNKDRIILSEQGKRYLNNLTEMFLPAK